mmetsp:Transcript_69780/g.179952  ORF Transcript_69780/g.179952 Transcript_69780/m.179952 type:complete len:589 (+) Transcript_69780:18-1784(+)
MGEQGGGLSFGAATAGYEDDVQAKLCNEACVMVFRALHAVAAGSHNYIFEIGSGTGGTSSFVIPTCNPLTTRYVFSDLSQAFLSNARTRFGAFPFMEYTIFNGDIHPANQGFHCYEMNQILATNVIHATQHLASTMCTIHVLLGPGGHIVFNEVCNPGTLVEDLTYGLTDGWWMLTDIERRVTYPLMQTPSWNSLFKATGFQPVWHTPCDGYVFSQQAVLVAGVSEGQHMSRTYQDVAPCFKMDPSASYLVTGAVGGLGLLSALIMLERGARHLHFVSRRDRVPTEAMQLFSVIAGASCTIKRQRCNVSSASEVARILVDVPDAPLCQGFIHGAGVLSDGTVIRQTRQKYEEVFGPKHFGAYSLHRFSSHKLQKMQLSVMFSSGAGFLGSPGQNNHSSANCGIDGLIAMTACMGLPGGSISWGAVADIGYAARHNVAAAENSVRYDHAWLALEAVQARCSSHMCIAPGAHFSGQGALPMRAATYAGAAGRFRMSGMRKAPKMNLLQGQRPDHAAMEAGWKDMVAPLDSEKAEAEALPGGRPLSAAPAEFGDIFGAMKALHKTWQKSGTSGKGGDEANLSHVLGTQEVC